MAALLPLYKAASAFTPHLGRRAFSSSSSLLQASSCDVAVLGGGFGGLYTALQLDKTSRQQGLNLDVTLVDPSDSFVFLPLLYDLTVGTATVQEVCPLYRDLLLGTNIRHVKDSLVSLDSTKACLEKGELEFQASVVAVGATPQTLLQKIPGAHLAQPFYTKKDALATQDLLLQMEKTNDCEIAVIGGGFAGVELAACVQRRLPNASVTLVSRTRPMEGTRAESWVTDALQQLGVSIQTGSVAEIKSLDQQYGVVLSNTNETSTYDSVLWTAGSGPAAPVSEGLDNFVKTATGRLALDSTLRCKGIDGSGLVPVWALGDCSEVPNTSVPKTAQAAMQQADVVAQNVLSHLQSQPASKTFEFQDLGSMLSLGGPNAAVLAPKEGSLLAPLFAPVLELADQALSVADKVVEKLPAGTPNPRDFGLSLSSHGLGASSSSTGSLAGTLSGAARRAVYAARMPTDQQRAVSAVSAFLSTATALAQEAARKRKD